MELHSAISVVRKSIEEDYNHLFVVTKNDGTKEKMRLFLSLDGNLCAFKKRSKSKGYIVAAYFWKDVKPITANRVKFFNRNISKILKYLHNSGYWQHLIPGLENLGRLSNDEVEELYHKDYRQQEQFLSERGIEHISIDMLHCLYLHDCITTVRYSQESWIKKAYIKAISDKRDWSGRWVGNYDYSIELKVSDGNPRAWYSEEYHNCGNGYYYLLLDDKHVSFKEKD